MESEDAAAKTTTSTQLIPKGKSALDLLDDAITKWEAKYGAFVAKVVESSVQPSKKSSALELLDDAIADLEAKLNLLPGESKVIAKEVKPSSIITAPKPPAPAAAPKSNNPSTSKKKKAGAANNNEVGHDDLPDILKLEFKVGQIRKVWDHPTADKLYCEEIDVGEDQPRSIASGLRPYFTLDQMLGQRLLVVSNLKPKNLVGFPSHGMVLCAVSSSSLDDDNIVEFVEPPPNAVLGEVITFENLPPPRPWTPAQVEKKKIWNAVVADLNTNHHCLAAWKDHLFMTSHGPCRTKTIALGKLR